MTEQIERPHRPRERRTARKPRLTINQILDRMQDEADTEHNGNLPDNVLGIYNSLSTDDKRTFLRKSLEALWDKQLSYAQEGLHEIVLAGEDTSASGDVTKKEIRISPVEIQSERESIETANPQEQKRLRQWFLKLLLVMMVAMFLVVILFTSLYGENDLETIMEAASSITKLIELLLK